MQVSVNFFTPGPQLIYAVNEDTGRDLYCLTDVVWLKTAATVKLFLKQPDGTVYSQSGTNIHMGNTGAADYHTNTWRTALKFENIPFTQQGLHAACVEVVEDGKTITSLPFYLAVERSIQ